MEGLSPLVFSMKETLHYDESEDRLTIHTVQDVEPIIDSVKRHKEIITGKPIDGLGYFAGRIPGNIVRRYCIEHGITYADFMREDIHIQRIMNDPDYKRFRVWEGNI